MTRAIGPYARPSGSLSLPSLVRRWPVASFIVLAYGMSWAVWIPMIVRGEVVTPGGNVSHFAGLLGPALAAVLVTSFVGGRSGLRNLWSRGTRWRLSPRWHLAALVPLLTLAFALAVMAAMGTPVAFADIARFSGLPELGLPLVFVVVMLVNGYGEETGWRGFLTPRLDSNFGFVSGCLLVALVWAGWHLPLFFVVETYRQAGAAIIPLFSLGLAAGALVLGWLYLCTESIFLVALWHTGLNLATATVAGRGLPSALATTVVMVWALVIAVRAIGHRSPRATDEARSALALDESPG